MSAPATPTPKVAAGGISGAAALLIVWVAGQFGLEVPPEVAAAFVLVLTFGASYIKTDTTPGKHAA